MDIKDALKDLIEEGIDKDELMDMLTDMTNDLFEEDYQFELRQTRYNYAYMASVYLQVLFRDKNIDVEKLTAEIEAELIKMEKENFQTINSKKTEIKPEKLEREKMNEDTILENFLAQISK